MKPDLPGTRLEDAEAVMQALEQCQVDAILGSEVVMLVRPREVVETERKLAEALRQSEQRFRLALTNSPVSVFEQDLDLRYTWIYNPKLGFVADQVIGKTDAELVDPASAATLEALKRGVIDTGQPIRQEVATVVRGEPPTCFDLYVEPHRDEDGRIIGVICASTDITGRKAIDEQLRRSEALYRGIGESIDYGVWVCDPDGRNTYASESFLKMVGITQQQCSDFGWGDVLHPDDAAATLAAWQECVRTGGDWNREHRFRGVDGAWHHVLARGVPIRDEQGTVVSWAGINLD
ncbi:MAG: PAS domain S-box protein, partial [Desulfobacteraceae bacterium]